MAQKKDDMKNTPVVPPVYMTATYQFDNSDDLIDVVQNRTGFIYSRWDNPSVLAAEKKLAALEGYPHALGFGSGMAAITNTILALAPKNSRIIGMREVYGGTHEFLFDYLPRWGIDVVEVGCENPADIHDEIDKGVDLVYLETPTNPLLRVVDVADLTAHAHEKNAIVILDSTFASPVNQRPLELGVDVTIHSATKYLGGHHDITAGFACCNDILFEKIWDLRKVLGGVMDPMSAFLALRGMGTLDLRVKRQNENAMTIAHHLENHEKVEVVYYPGLPSHPDHAIAKRQMTGFGGMMSFVVESDFEGTKRVMDGLKLIKLATSLGGITTLANQPATNTHVALSPQALAEAGIKENLVRLSTGTEDVLLLIEDLEQALALA